MAIQLNSFFDLRFSSLLCGQEGS